MTEERRGTEELSRIRMLVGDSAMERLQESRVAVFGIGGVGGFAAEALVRSGIGAIDLIDHDTVSRSNLNRQIIATRSTVGQMKTEAAAALMREIRPECRVTVHPVFFLPDTRDSFDFSTFDYVVDAIDTVAGKLALVSAAQAAGTPVISAMGAGNKMDPTALRVAEIEDTSVCPLARIMRSECRKRGIRHLKVVYSTELPMRPEQDGDAEAEKQPGRRTVPGSAIFVPAAMGMAMAAEVVRDIIKTPARKHAAPDGE